MQIPIKLLKDTHREKAPSNKTPPLPKSMTFGWLVHQVNYLYEFLKQKQNF